MLSLLTSLLGGFGNGLLVIVALMHSQAIFAYLVGIFIYCFVGNLGNQMVRNDQLLDNQQWNYGVDGVVAQLMSVHNKIRYLMETQGYEQ